MKFQFLPENFSRSENAPPFETRKIRLFEVERIFLKNKKMLEENLTIKNGVPSWSSQNIGRVVNARNELFPFFLRYPFIVEIANVFVEFSFKIFSL